MIEVTLPTVGPIVATLGADAPAVTMPGRTPVLVTVTLQGPQGPVGPAGADGPPGIAPYVHTQASPAAEWIINHNRGAALGVTVFTVGGVEVEADVVTVTPNQTRVYFATPTAGSARLF